MEGRSVKFSLHWYSLTVLIILLHGGLLPKIHRSKSSFFLAGNSNAKSIGLDVVSDLPHFCAETALLSHSNF